MQKKTVIGSTGRSASSKSALGLLGQATSRNRDRAPAIRVAVGDRGQSVLNSPGVIRGWDTSRGTVNPARREA
jgi:hypothetical protein